ncbi:hypothetical protein [Catellatospora sp. NPDC049133]|uniref:hypothetical protein n=1 Tax=Catellatospora sp. NPDC049133 TaxID=3155499 RepID=UPI00340855F2
MSASLTVSKSGVLRILHRLGVGRLPASQRHKRHDRRWKRYENQPPGHRIQVDVKLPRAVARQALLPVLLDKATHGRHGRDDRWLPSGRRSGSIAVRLRLQRCAGLALKCG